MGVMLAKERLGVVAKRSREGCLLAIKDAQRWRAGPCSLKLARARKTEGAHRVVVAKDMYS